MVNTRLAIVGLLATIILGATFFGGRAGSVFAQQGETGTGQTAPRRNLIHHLAGTKLTEQQTRGAGLFFQHCSLCHLAKTSGEGGIKYCCLPSLGPNLKSLFQDLTPDEETALRNIILNGGPTYMPAWKYGLAPNEIDDIIAYLKTLD